MIVKSPSMRGVAEEIADAYKDVTAMVDAPDASGIGEIAPMEPLICVKGRSVRCERATRVAAAVSMARHFCPPSSGDSSNGR
jgi:hypothetical protein